MKLLLTSCGPKNNSIVNALEDLAWKPLSDSIITVVLTASMWEPWDKTWVIDWLLNLKNIWFKEIEIVDIASINKDSWMAAFKKSDIIFFKGGDTYYLMEQIEKSWLAASLKDLLKDKVYMWASAWAMVTTKTLPMRCAEIYNEEKAWVEWLWFVNFYMLPHLNSEYFTSVREENVREKLSDFKEKVYVLDDNSALKVDWDNFDIISEWEWFEIN